jgi:hypothetical protein
MASVEVIATLLGFAAVFGPGICAQTCIARDRAGRRPNLLDQLGNDGLEKSECVPYPLTTYWQSHTKTEFSPPRSWLAKPV